MYIEQEDILRNAGMAQMAYSALNNAGQGFAPMTGQMTLVRPASTTDGLAIYRLTDEDGDQWLVLVGTDASGSEDSEWAVRVPELGVHVTDEGEYSA